MVDAPEKIWVFPCAGCTMLAAETEQINQDTTPYIREDVAQELEAKLEKAVEALGDAVDLVEELNCGRKWSCGRSVLAELGEDVTND